MLQYKKIPEIFTNPIIETRFWSKVQKSDINKCWEWTAGCVKGYGQFGIHTKKCFHMMKAHRMAWFYFNKKDPFDKLVCHSCDNPKCCNPNHLWLGTPKQNMIDRENKGRSQKGDNHFKRRHPELLPRGSNHHNAILNEKIVSKIRRLYKTGKYTNRKISEMLGLKRDTVKGINYGNTWTHVK